MRPQERKRLLALEIRSSKFGYAVFDGPIELLDWGVRWFGEKTSSPMAAASDRTRFLLNLHAPGTVVTRERNYFSLGVNRRFAMIMRAIRIETRRHHAAFKVLTTHQVQRCFALHGCATKHEIATHLAKQFEVLSWRLPERRKPHNSEPRATVIFDAAATGVAFLEKSARQSEKHRSVS